MEFTGQIKRLIRGVSVESNDILRGIALRVYHGRHGSFLRTYANAYLQADTENEKVMRSNWMHFIDKYLKHEVAQEEAEG